MKTKKGLKRIAALIMCVVLLATSLPIALAANGAYNPAPYFTQEAQEKGAAAWLDEGGNLQIRFPAAVGRPTHAVWSKNPNETVDVKEIDYYIVEVSDLGGKLEKHNTQPPVLLSKKVWASDIMALAEGDTLYAVFTADEIGDLLNVEDNRYNVAITAVDKAGWFSLTLHALIFDVPEFYFDMDKFEVLSEDPYAMREMMRFDQTIDNMYNGYQQTGGTIDKCERAGQTGAEDPETGVDTTGYRIRIIGNPGEGGQTFDTSESRQTWDFKGAKEVWYWMDLSEVELQGLSFRLRANEKRIDYTITNKGIDVSQHYGSIVYSTLGTNYNTYAEGEEPYVLVQNANGNWQEVMMQNGTIDLGHFKGYVRIPIQFFCSETASSVQSHNTPFGQEKTYNKTDLSRYYDDEVILQKCENGYKGEFEFSAEIDPAGTPIGEALLIHNGKLKASRFAAPTLEWQMGNFLAPGIDTGDMKDPNNKRRASLEKDADGNWYVPECESPEGYYTALEDIYSAGLAYNGVSADSINKSMFLDNIMFYRTDREAWPEATIGNDPNLTKGTTVNTYYNQRTDAQDRILDAIDQYIGTPSWSDYRGVRYVTDMINAYFSAYKATMGENYAKQFLSTAALKGRAEKAGRLETWQNYVDAQTLCQENGLLDSNNSQPNDLVPMLVQSLEALPDPSQVTSISDTLREEIIKLYSAYVRLNYGQLKMLGSYAVKDADGNVTALYEEEKLLAYIELLADSLTNGGFVTGYKIANYPFIKFNDFENNEIGDRAWALEDDPNYSGESDYRHVKGLVSFATSDRTDVDAIGKNVSATYSGSFHIDAANSEVTQNGYNGSQGLTTTFDSNWLDGGTASNGSFYTVSVSKDSKDADTFGAFKANNMSSVALGELAKNNDVALEDASNKYLPFSLVMYVDFTEFAESDPDFTFMPSIYTEYNGDVKARPMMGNQFGDVGVKAIWKTYYLLDSQTGEWTRVYNDERYMFTSSSTSSEGLATAQLRGYKGYIAIPMQHFKLNTAASSQQLDRTADSLNKIYAVQFAISGGNTDGKSFTIDNIGFTYDPEFYTGLTRSVADPSYAEVFGAKSTKASDFEQAVAEIDPYDTETLNEKIEAAKAIYGYPYQSETVKGTLSQWQKDNITTVQQAKALLDKYIAGDIPQAAMTVAELKTAIATLPNIPENATTKNPLPNPGFITDSANPIAAGEVNYAAFGFASREQAEEIAKLYTETYRRLSVADKASLTDEEKAKLLNAYNATARCTGTLEMIRDNAISFADALKTVYKPYTDGTQTLNLLKAADRQTIVDLSANQYEALAYYAKTGLGDGTIISAYANMTDGLSRYLANTNKVNVDGEEVTGGVYKLMEQYTQLYKEVKAKLDAKETLPDELVARLKETVAEYNDLIPAYKNVFELYYGSEQADASGEYQGIKDIMELFLQTDVAFADGTKETTLALTSDNIDTTSQTLNVNYLEEYPVETGGASSTYFIFEGYDGYLKSGTTMRTYQLMLNGNTLPLVGVDGEPIRLDDTLLGDTLKNNTYTAENPFEMVFTAKLTDKAPFAEQLSDKVTVKHYRPADPEKGETEPQLLGTYILNITYMPDEAYTVSIPAEFPVDWGTAETDVSYSVDCVLKEGSKIAVNVAGAGQLTAVKDTSLVMGYTAQAFAPTEFRGVQTAVKPSALPMVLINEDTWNTVPVGEYRDTLTYTVEYTSAP